MSYNIDSVQEIVLDACMYVADIKKLHKELEDQLPECNFLSELMAIVEDNKLKKPDEPVDLESFQWYGEGSGRSHELLVRKIAPRIHGHVEAIFTWEGGDSHSGLYIKDGKVKECDVELRLVLPKEDKG